MQEIKIDKGIPAPIKIISNFPFDKMKVGDSFLIPTGASINSIRTYSQNFAKTNKVKFSIKKTAEGYRCWRIK